MLASERLCVLGQTRNIRWPSPSFFRGGRPALDPKRRVADDRRRPPEKLFEKVIEQVAQRRRDAVVVLAADDDERVGGSVQRRQVLERLRRLALRVLLVHPIEQRQLQRHWIDNGDLMAALGRGPLDEARGLDALTIRADRADQNRDLQAYCGSAILRANDRGRPTRTPRSRRTNSPSDHAWNGQPRGVNGASASAISEMCPSPAVSRCCRSGSRNRNRAVCLTAAVLPRTRIHASTNGPISHGHTVPWW